MMQPAPADSIAQYFDRAASDWDAEHGPDSPRAGEFEARFLLMRRLCSRFAQPRVLDVGCGTGSLLLELASGITEGVGIDLSSAMISKATKEAARQQLNNIRFRAADATALDAAGLGEFDLVVFNDVLEHIERREEALRQARAALRDNGRVIVIMAHKSNLAFLWYRVWRRRSPRIFAEDRYYTPRGLARIGRVAGLATERVEALPRLPDYPDGKASKLVALAARLLARLMPTPLGEGAFAIELRLTDAPPPTRRKFPYIRFGPLFGKLRRALRFR
jgi:SAM-dependent methyltransferase